MKAHEAGIPYIYNDAAPAPGGVKARWDDPGGNPVSTTNSKGFTFKGNSTVGYGHKLHSGPVDESNALDKPYMDRNAIGDDLTQQEMDDLLAQDFVERGGVGSGASSFNKRVHVPLYQHEYDALVNQMFNGTNGKPAIFVNRGRYTAAGQAFLQYKSAVTTRRAIQNKMFMKGEYE